MFSRKFRLPPQAMFLQGKPIANHFFTLKIVSNMLSYNRYGFVVSKQIDKRATERNKLKRRFRACIESLHTSLLQGNDMLFILKSDAKGKTMETLSEEIKNITSLFK